MGKKTTGVFVWGGEDVEWLVSRTTVVFMKEREGADCWAIRTINIFVGEGEDHKCSVSRTTVVIMSEGEDAECWVE